jgi:hypothetical protein
MFKKIKEFFLGKPAPAPAPVPAPTVESAPYKVPEPAATTLIPLIVTNSNPADNVPVVAEVAAPVVVETPVVVEVAAKKPRKPRTPKVAPVAEVKEKAPAKAKAPKLTVVKSTKAAKTKSKKV